MAQMQQQQQQQQQQILGISQNGVAERVLQIDDKINELAILQNQSVSSLNQQISFLHSNLPVLHQQLPAIQNNHHIYQVLKIYLFV
jgi:hypothetical protein